MKSWEVIKGPYLWKRGPVPPKPEGEAVQDYYRGHVKAIELSRNVDAAPTGSIEDTEKGITKDAPDPIIESASSEPSSSVPADSISKLAVSDLDTLPWYTPRNLFAKAKYYFFRG